MIEFYTFLLLSSVGYFMTAKQSNKISQVPLQVPIQAPAQVPKATPKPTPTPAPTFVSAPARPTKQQTTHDVNQIVEDRAKVAYDKLRPDTVLRVQKNSVTPESSAKVIKSQLSGQNIAKTEFISSDVLPYFGGSVKQNTSTAGPNPILEMYTGNTDATEWVGPRKAIPPMYDKTKNMDNIYGNNGFYIFEESRMQRPTVTNHELPFDRVQVGVGVKQGFTNKPSGGLNQDARTIVMPKTVDELRIATNPKTTYEGRTVNGMGTTQRGKIGEVSKHSVDTYYENNPDRYFTTLGQHTKPVERAIHQVKDTKHAVTTREYIGNGFNNERSDLRIEEYQEPTRPELRAFETRNNTSVMQRRHNDYGKCSIRIYDNERNITTEKTQTGNIQSAFKAMISPITDVMRFTNKEYTVSHPRQFGILHAQAPDKLTVHDSEHLTRTTIKETTLEEARAGNINAGANSRSVVYDPDEIAKITIRQTTATPDNPNISSGKHGSHYVDPDESARITMRQTMDHAYHPNVSKGEQRIKTVNPDEVAKTTIRQTMDHSYHPNVQGQDQRAQTINPDETAKTTIRQTIEHAYHPNVQGTDQRTQSVNPEDSAKTTIRQTIDHAYHPNVQYESKRSVSINPDEEARMTIKETTLDETRVGNINTLAGENAYITSEYEAPITLKETTLDGDYLGGAALNENNGYQIAPNNIKNTQNQFLSDNDHYGIASKNKGNGYQTVPKDLKNTHKQFLSDNDHYGAPTKAEQSGYETAPRNLKNTTKQFLSDTEHYGIGQGANMKERSNHAEKNIQTNAEKEMLSAERVPTWAGVKVSPDVGDLHMEIKKAMVINDDEMVIDHVVNRGPSVNLVQNTTTRTKNNFNPKDIGDRLDVHILDGFKNNPYTQRLDSAA